MANFTPISAAIGGGLIGLSAVMLMMSMGRIAGISGIFGGLLDLSGEEKGRRTAFIAGSFGPFVASLIGYKMPAPQMPARWAIIIAAGLLVGFRTKLGGICTSGHGICGVARLELTWHRPNPPTKIIEFVIVKRNGALNGFNQWTFNGEAFSMESMKPKSKVYEGGRYLLKFRHASNDIHPLHLHRHSFELVRVGGNRQLASSRTS